MNLAQFLIMFHVVLVLAFALTIEKSFSFFGAMLGIYVVFCFLSKISSCLVNSKVAAK
jgi:hypothetical protein